MPSPNAGHPDLQNHHNLTAMWAALGALPVPGLEPKGGRLAEGWPDRAWLAPGEVPSAQDLQALDRARGQRPIQLPIWGEPEPELAAALSAAGYEPVLAQTAMSLRPKRPRQTKDEGGAVEVLSEPELLPGWTSAVSVAFGYAFDPAATRRLFADPRATIFMTKAGGEISATGVTYATGSTLGIYWVGVVPDYRRRGLARALMRGILAQIEDPVTLLTLQASAAGRHLYESLGFRGQTEIQTYRAPG